jgi:large subunit ribosomal protein L2
MVKKFNPITPGLRNLVLESNLSLTKNVKPEKSLLTKKIRTNGRNHNGHITCRHKGGGHKRLYRIIDFKRDKEEMQATVASIEYDPNRTAHIALVNYTDGEKRYIIAPQGLVVGAKVMTSDKELYDIGCCMRLKFMPLGSVIHNLEMHPGRGGALVRSAGLSAQLVARSDGMATIKMPSGEMRLLSENCRATFGKVSNEERSLRMEGKAGRSRWKGIRPTVRGTVMNPVDHPMGGGEGKSSGGLPRSPTSVYAKGYRTRNKKKSSKMIIKDRRKK